MGMGETYLNVLGTQVNVGGQQQLGVFGSQSKRFRQRHDIFFVNRTAGGENWKKRRKISQSAQEGLAQSVEVRMSRLLLVCTMYGDGKMYAVGLIFLYITMRL